MALLPIALDKFDSLANRALPDSAGHDQVRIHDPPSSILANPTDADGA